VNLKNAGCIYNVGKLNRQYFLSSIIGSYRDAKSVGWLTD